MLSYLLFGIGDLLFIFLYLFMHSMYSIDKLSSFLILLDFNLFLLSLMLFLKALYSFRQSFLFQSLYVFFSLHRFINVFSETFLVPSVHHLFVIFIFLSDKARMLLSLELYRELLLKISILCIFHFVFKFRQFSVDYIILIIEMNRDTLITKGAFFC